MAATKKTIAEDGSTPAAATLQTKSAMMSGILAAMASMSNDDMMSWFPDAMALAGQTPDASKQNADSIRTGNKGVVAEDAKALFTGDDLTEEAQTKFLTLIEHAVSMSETLIRATLDEEYETKLVEATTELHEAITEKVDQYLSYAVEEWQKKNAVAIESSLRVERANRVIDVLGNLMAEMKIEIPEGEGGVVEGLRAELDKAKADLSEQIEANIAASEALTRVTALNVFKDVAEGMTKIDVEKFKTLVEGMEISDDVEEMKTKLSTIKEAHFKKSAPGVAGAKGLTEELDNPAATGATLTEETTVPDANDPASMAVAAYKQRYSR